MNIVLKIIQEIMNVICVICPWRDKTIPKHRDARISFSFFFLLFMLTDGQ